MYKDGFCSYSRGIGKWASLATEEMTWENYGQLRLHFSHMNLEDKVRLEGCEGMMRTPVYDLDSWLTQDTH